MDADLEPWLDKLIPINYSPGYIALSYFVSFCGCWTAVELLHRRTGSKGLHNWYLLLGAATAMGAVAIWCMHYIGNRAISMLHGEPEVQINYSPGFTAGSFFLAVCTVSVAFYFFSMSERVTWISTIIGGLFMGSAVCGMHYLGQGGITNYFLIYWWPYVFGSALIAVLASTLALSIFFYLKSAWINSWQKRGACASLLSLAVSGMHWCGTRGTKYKLRKIAESETLAPTHVINAVTVLSVAACLVLIMLAIISQRSRQRSTERARQVVLACVTFDANGKLMVDSEGLLPCRKITNAFIEKSYDEVFDICHPVYSWIFRASRSWQSIADLIPAIRDHLRLVDTAKAFSAAAFSSPVDETKEGLNDYELIFKELFCVAATELASSIQQPLLDLGVLFDDMMETGTLAQKTTLRSLFKRSHRKSDDLEAGDDPSHTLLGRGQLLFIVRQISKAESARLQTSGHGFAHPVNVVENIARSMQVPQAEIASRLARMETYCSDENLLEPGVYLACFALRPLLQRGFDVLVRKDARNLLPTVQLPIDRLETLHRHILAMMDGWTIERCYEALSNQFLFSSEDEKLAVMQLHVTIRELMEKVGNPAFKSARLVAQPFIEQCAVASNADGAQKVTIIAFKTIFDAHGHAVCNKTLQFVPLKVYITQQHAFNKSPNIDIFSRRIHREFGSLVRRQERRGSPRRQSYTSTRNVIQNDSASVSRGRAWFRMRSISLSALGDDRSNNGFMISPSGVSQPEKDISRRGSSADSVELRRLASINEAGDVEEETIAEKLVALTIDERKRRPVMIAGESYSGEQQYRVRV